MRGFNVVTKAVDSVREFERPHFDLYTGQDLGLGL